MSAELAAAAYISLHYVIKEKRKKQKRWWQTWLYSSKDIYGIKNFMADLKRIEITSNFQSKSLREKRSRKRQRSKCYVTRPHLFRLAIDVGRILIPSRSKSYRITVYQNATQRRYDKQILNNSVRGITDTKMN